MLNRFVCVFRYSVCIYLYTVFLPQNREILGRWIASTDSASGLQNKKNNNAIATQNMIQGFPEQKEP